MTEYILILVFMGSYGSVTVEVERFETLSQCQAVGYAAIDRKGWTSLDARNRESLDERNVFDHRDAKFKCLRIIND